MIKVILGVLFVVGILIFWKNKNTNQETYKQYIWRNEKENFKTDFLKILTDNPSLRYLVIDFNHYYIQFIGLDESQKFYCEIVSNEFLIEQKILSKNQIDEILGMQFKKPNEKDSEGNSSPNYSKFYKANKDSNLKEIYQELIYLMTKVYGIENSDIIKVRFK